MHLEFMVSFQVFIIILYREDVEWPLIMMMVITALLLMKMDVLLNGQQGGTQARVKGCMQEPSVLLFLKIYVQITVYGV